MKIILDETLFLETLASVMQSYPKISEDDFMRLIALDPTYIKGRDSVGKYGKWILNLFNKGLLDNEGHVFDVLTRFDSNRKFLKNKDVGQFKSIQAVDDYLNNPDNYNEESARQKVRSAQKARKNADLDNEAEHVISGTKWDVWVPKSYAASCKLGQGSSWCTATTESDHYYNYYSSKGPLYILIHKTNPELKYQFNFETGSFMDIDDYPMENPYTFIKESDDLRDLFLPKFAAAVGIDLSQKDISFTIPHEKLGGYFADMYTTKTFNGNSCDGEFICDVLCGDTFKYFEYGMDYVDASNAPLDELDNFVLEELNRLGISEDDLSEIVHSAGNEPDDCDYSNEVYDAIRSAMADGDLVGTECECYNDLVETILNSDSAGIFVTNTPDGFCFNTTSEQLLENFYDDEYMQLFDYGRQGMPEDVLKIWMYNFEFHEPYYGWHGFDVAAFNDRLADCLYEIR